MRWPCSSSFPPPHPHNPTQLVLCPPSHPPTRDLAPPDALAVQLLAGLLGVVQLLKLHKGKGLLDLAALRGAGRWEAGEW